MQEFSIIFDIKIHVVLKSGLDFFTDPIVYWVLLAVKINLFCYFGTQISAEAIRLIEKAKKCKWRQPSYIKKNSGEQHWFFSSLRFEMNIFYF